MAEYHHHPDGLIYVRAETAEYADTPENFALDYGAPAPALPEGERERIYTPGDRHVICGRYGDIAQEMPWPQGDAIIAACQTLVDRAASRLNQRPV
jgi:hypothetical protein